MAIDKLIPQYLNSDTDQKLVKSVEMTDNLNVRVSNDAEGTGGVIKNVKGTEVVGFKSAADEFPAGSNRVVGSVSNEKNKEILFLVWNSNNNHGIYRLDMTSGKYQKLYQDSVLNFKKFSYAACDVIVNEDNETLFYWTDNVNPPMKVNINRLINGSYPASLTTGTNAEKLLSLTVAKQPPIVAPSYNIVNNPNLPFSNIYEKHFQFAYQYKYADGEISALSPYSSHSIATSQLKDGFIDDGARNFYNQIDVYVKNSVADVDEIILYARRDNSETFYQVDKIKNTGTSNTTTISFIDDKVSSALSVDEINKIYDNVPQKAKSLAIAGSRLMYGNYEEGYANTDVDSLLTPVHYPEKTTFDIGVSNYDTSANVLNLESTIFELDSNEFEISIDFSNIPANVSSGTEIILNYTLLIDALKVARVSGFNLFQSAEYGEIDVTFLDSESGNLDTVSYEVGNPNPINNTIPRMATLSLQPLNIKKSIKISSSQTKSQVISTIQNSLTSDTFHCVVDGDKNENYDNSTLSGAAANKAKGMFAGSAAFKFQNILYATATDTWRVKLRFAGAKVFLKYLWAQDGNWFTNNFKGSKEMNIIESSSVDIGGESGYSIYPSAKQTNHLEYVRYGVIGNSSIGGQLTGERSFKSNSYHEFGIVYIDDRGRTSGVNKIGQAYVDKKHDRTNKGKSSIDLRVKNSPPSWAKKWMPVYSGNQSYDYFLQYTASFGVAALDSEKVQGSSLSNKIYVSMSSLEGNEASYVKQLGAKINYKHEEGDVLRVLSYVDDSGNKVYPDDFKFKIIEYVYLEEERSSEFLFRAGQYEDVQGWYLVLEDKPYSGFSYSDLISYNSNWHKNAIVEIGRPKKNVEENIYFEMGKVYDISGGSHIGDRTSSVQTGGFEVTEASNNQGTGQSTDRYFVGDILNLGGGVFIEITSVTPLGDIIQYGFIYRGTAPSLSSYGTVTITNFNEAAIEITNGDCYERVRRLRKSTPFFVSEDLPEKFSSAYSYGVSYVEADSPSDFFGSKFYSKGRPFAYIPEAKTIRRRSSITYSDAYVLDSDRLNLSSFNLSLANWNDLDIINGSISSLINRGDALTVIQESKASQLPIGKNIIEFADGASNVTASRNVLGTASYYAGDYGTSNPESVVERFGVVYFVDAQASKVIKIGGDGITPISDNGMSSFFEDKFKNLTVSTDSVRIIGGFDPDNEEYLITVEPVYNLTITIDSTSYDVPSNADDNFVVQNIVFTTNTVLWNIWGNTSDVYCGNWDDIGNGVVYLDSVFQTNSILVDSAFSGSTATIDILITDSTYSFSAVGQLNLATGVLTIPSTTCDGYSITFGSSSAAEPGFTIAYKHKEGVWGAKYSFRPTSYVNINNELFSFFESDAGLMWKHNVNSTRNNFYGTQYNSIVESVSNFNPSMIKVYEALGIEGNGTWSATLSNSEQTTTIGSSDFDVREGHRYGMIFRDTSASTEHQIYIGKVESIDAVSNTITFTTPVNRLPFVVGDELKTASGSNLVATGEIIDGITDRKTIQCTNAITGIVVGDDVFVEHSSRIDGDPMRDVFLKVRITSGDTSKFEVHALSLSYDRSRLHNDRIN